MRNHTFHFVVGASDMGVGQEQTNTVFVEFFCNRSSSLRWQGSSFFVQVCWNLAGDSGVKPL